MPSMVTFFDVLQWLLTAGAGVAAWALLDVAERRGWIPGLAMMDFEAKRWTALGIAAVLTLAAWGVEIAFFYVAPPVSWRMGVEQAVSQLLVSLPLAFTTSQLAHARAETARGKAKREVA